VTLKVFHTRSHGNCKTRKPCCRRETARCSVLLPTPKLTLRLLLHVFYIHCVKADLPTYVTTIPQRHRQTDRRRDGRTNCRSYTALCVSSRGNETATGHGRVANCVLNLIDIRLSKTEHASSSSQILPIYVPRLHLKPLLGVGKRFTDLNILKVKSFILYFAQCSFPYCSDGVCLR